MARKSRTQSQKQAENSDINISEYLTEEKTSTPSFSGNHHSCTLENGELDLLGHRDKTAIYTRLSAQSDNSETMNNQISYCQAFVKERADLNLLKVYSDEGFSGTNFNRPKFTELMNDIKQDKINCIVVRDLSRFGRDYIETGIYLERIFPSLGTRFISINENYDSLNLANDNMIIPLHNMINSLYAKDISKKICSSNKIRILTGDFKRNTVAYGYILSEDRSKIIVDEETADYIKMIFKWKIEAVPIAKMIENLQRMKAPNPKTRKSETAVSLYKNSDSNWHYSTIQNILKNHAYLGQTVIGKKTQAFYKSQARRENKNPDDWIVIKNTHQAIISQEDFDKVQAIFSSRKGESR